MDIWYGLTGGGWPECCDGSSSDNDDNDQDKDCYERGIDDGKNDGFHSEKFRDCGEFNDSGDYEDNPYYKGFIDGCIDAGNTKETCERFIE